MNYSFLNAFSSDENLLIAFQTLEYIKRLIGWTSFDFGDSHNIFIITINNNDTNEIFFSITIFFDSALRKYIAILSFHNKLVRNCIFNH